MSNTDDTVDFEEQIRLQNEVKNASTTKTRVDPDGCVMEWDESRKAWFPKVDDDFLANYLMNYGTSQKSETSTETNTQAGQENWDSFNDKIDRMRKEKGDDSEEVQALVRQANERLQAYYDSPAYRAWYQSYVEQEQNTSKSVPPSESQPKPQVKSQVPKKSELKPSQRIKLGLDEGDDPDDALARAEAELQAGLPLAPTETTNVTEDVASSETDTQSVDQKPTTNKRKQSAPPPAWYQMDDDKNTHVYVTGLPSSTTEPEFIELMSKYGVLMNDPFTNKPRIKLYYNEKGQPKGDGRCCYVKVESVELALQILDGMQITPDSVLHVERAKFQPKGEFDPKKRRRLTLKEKKKIKEQQESIFKWGIDTSKFVRGKKERVLIIKNVFTEADFVHDVTLIPVVRDLLRRQCEKCGGVKKIVVFDTNPDGVVSVTFNSPEEADTGINFLHNSLFAYPGPGGVRQLSVDRWDGKTNYHMKEDQAEVESRMQSWKEYLGGSSSSDEDEEEGGRTSGQQSSERLVDNQLIEPIASIHPTETRQDWVPDSPNDLVDTDDELELRGGASGDETP